MDHLSISALSDLLATVLCGCVLPIYAIWQVVRRHMNDTDKRTQIVLAAIEKNPDMDIEELIYYIKDKVLEKYNVELKYEQIIIK